LQQQQVFAIRPMSHQDLRVVLEWRNHENVRRYMYTQHEIRMEEHSEWFARASVDPKRHLLIFEKNSQPLGFVNISEIASGGIAEWGFYTAPDAPQGTGSALGRVTLDYAFLSLGLHKICGQAIELNERSIQFHLKLGFLNEGVLQKHHFDGKLYHNVWCFGLLSEFWNIKQSKDIYDKVT
jgi:UDP-4-amino-4,6-dideoxy-N-acetyl-beta-L-altrosamine N-acetyltransferase